MIEEKDLTSVNVLCEKINFEINRDKLHEELGKEIENEINIGWGLKAIKKDNKGLRFGLDFKIKSTIISGEINLTMFITTDRPITNEEGSSKENHKFIIKKSLPYIAMWVSESTAKMGIVPFVVSYDEMAAVIDKG